MHGLQGDRFLKRFAGNLKHRQKHPPSKAKEQKPETVEEMVAGSDSHAAKEDKGKEAINTEETQEKKQTSE